MMRSFTSHLEGATSEYVDQECSRTKCYLSEIGTNDIMSIFPNQCDTYQCDNICIDRQQFDILTM